LDNRNRYSISIMKRKNGKIDSRFYTIVLIPERMQKLLNLFCKYQYLVSIDPPFDIRFFKISNEALIANLRRNCELIIEFKKYPRNAR